MQIEKSQAMSFHEILRLSVNNKSNSRPPRIEVTGILLPVVRGRRNSLCKFKLESESAEYYLTMDPTLEVIAKKFAWEEVTVMGYLDRVLGVLEVEKISARGPTDSVRWPSVPADSEMDFYERTIATRGKLEPAPGYC